MLFSRKKKPTNARDNKPDPEKGSTISVPKISNKVQKPKNSYLELYKDFDREWRWRLVSTNGRILADSGQGYNRKRDAKEAMDRVKVQVKNAVIREVELQD